ncbi:type I-E CRISPR-associated protein Cse2/CasB [Tsukamurella sp. NPDC003166]|uniref:type I-E CRISPR-associated protein Cse2/CasB n=1 Tax=Tsukamurella sp. NPDC003166 TaxID=3154444 RepID=UPI0033B1F5B8
MSSPDPLTDHVRTVIARLQDGALKNRAGAVTTLARLRRAPLNDPTADPSVYQVVFEGFPQQYQTGELPTHQERAAYVAACLFSHHQQSKSEHMHRVSQSSPGGYGLGTAIRRLAQENGTIEPDSAVVRRFNALATADHDTEVIHHVRGLVGRLRAANLALDYGRLARDLADLFSGERSRRERVQLAWARDFSRPAPSKRASTPSVPSADSTTTH